MPKTVVLVLNWNGANDTIECVKSLGDCDVIVIDNGSTDESVSNLEQNIPSVTLMTNSKNLGFAKGVNAGFKKAIEMDYEYVATINNDATSQRNWLSHLEKSLDVQPNTGIVTSKILSVNGSFIDSTGEMMTIWGLPFPRGRDSTEKNKFDSSITVFGASGGASLYRVQMLKEIGLFDEDFFAYYEDVDLSFRAQLAGWKIAYQPKAIVYHKIGMTSGRIKGFTTVQTIKNLPWVMVKNVPLGLLPKILPRFILAYSLFITSAFTRKQGRYAAKGLLISLLKLPKKLAQRVKIQRNKKVSSEYIWSILVHDLPPNAKNLRSLRSNYWKITRKSNA